MTLYREVGTINTFIEPAAPVVRPAPVPVPQPDELKALVEKSLDDDQAEDVVVIDLAGKTSIADYMIVASGRNTRHIAAMAMKLADRMKQAGLRGVEVEGLNQCDWVLVDAGDVIIHLFRPEVRTFYNIEKMWGLETPRPSEERMSA
ncbi:ribosome-associated protein [Azospirillum baldaniorum]|uniref:ribosome silencing factor n=1 Tax=Azospirillum baldaniorum TaxID=1064539 RepID=UPI0011A434AA|nr:ribosome silencing factor [Azospirillum baldaniorum]TWA69461.1 ribosome-associated protein [Azospirillum baldaniorum]